MLAVLLLLDADNICGTFVASEQVLAILRLEKLRQCLDAEDDRDDAYLSAAKIKHRVYKVMPRSFIAQLHFEPLIEKLHEAVTRRRDLSIGPTWLKPPDVSFKSHSRHKIDFAR